MTIRLIHMHILELFILNFKFLNSSPSKSWSIWIMRTSIHLQISWIQGIATFLDRILSILINRTRLTFFIFFRTSFAKFSTKYSILIRVFLRYFTDAFRNFLFSYRSLSRFFDLNVGNVRNVSLFEDLISQRSPN